VKSREKHRKLQGRMFHERVNNQIWGKGMGLFNKREANDNEETGEVLSEVEEIRKSVLNAKMPQKVLKVALKEIERLDKTDSGATEYTIGINYLEYLASLPWNMMTEDNLDIARAQKILDAEHF
jgi:ATP-dependent Lon protease